MLDHIKRRKKDILGRILLCLEITTHNLLQERQRQTTTQIDSVSQLGEGLRNVMRGNGMRISNIQLIITLRNQSQEDKAYLIDSELGT